jgi:hypothetical protein
MAPVVGRQRARPRGPLLHEFFVMPRGRSVSLFENWAFALREQRGAQLLFGFGFKSLPKTNRTGRRTKP